MAATDWTGAGKDGFDNRVEAIYHRLNEDLDGDAYAVNGRGGDGGIDIFIRRDGRVTIVQVKFFPEGFAGGWAKSRRPQIERSLKRALQHELDEWHLVVPGTLTTSERLFVTGLSKTGKPKIKIVDRPALDSMAAGMPDLVTYFERDTLQEAAKVYNQERALLIDADDLTARVAALGTQADTLDPDWTFSFFRDGDVVGRQLVAKHPLAAERSPIKASLGLNMNGIGDELRRAVERSLGYGTPERLDLPATVVARFDVEGPPFIASSEENVEVSFIPDQANVPNHAVSIRLQRLDGSSVTYTGQSTWVGSASTGYSLQARFFDAMRVEFLMPFDRSKSVTVNVDLEMAEREPSAVTRAINAIHHLQRAEAVELTIDGAGPLTFTRPKSNEDALPSLDLSLAALKAIADDLVVVQPTLNCYFGFPEHPTHEEMVELRCIRLMLEGKAIVIPGADQVSPVLNGDDAPVIRQMLSGESVTMLVTHDEYRYELFGQRLVIGPARIYMPRVRAIDGPQIIKAFDENTAAGTKMVLRSDAGYGFWMFIPGVFQADPDGKVRPVSLGLPGVEDAPDVARALLGDGAVLAAKS